MTSQTEKVGALVACLAAPIIVVAALSGNIARHIRMSQSSLLIGDTVIAAMLVFFVAMNSKRRNRRRQRDSEGG